MIGTTHVGVEGTMIVIRIGMIGLKSVANKTTTWTNISRIVLMVKISPILRCTTGTKIQLPL
jgi:hypothetical protein